MTELEISKLVKKHLGFSLFLAIAPMMFAYIINVFAGNDQTLLILVAPIVAVGASGTLIKNVLCEAMSAKPVLAETHLKKEDR